ncbi:glucooligosaccharide oxidase [Pseudohyphozyma bogoriensis]|nr:glucooligosaccharide oxidase [Pseudohyphozyma bogoriensis]
MLAYAPLLVALLCFAGTSATPILTRQNALANCLAPLTPVTSSDSSYSSDVASFNQRLEYTPAFFLKPTSVAQISSIVSCAASNGATVSARSGGHSYASYSTIGQVTIDLAAFSNITYNNADGTAVIGAGNRLGDIALALNDQGRALPHGTCPYVGIGGHASFGGFGLAGRMWGLTVDNIIGFDVVLANGTAVAGVTPDTDADLFWALAGSAPSYAIVTAFHVQTYAAPPTAINFDYSWPAGTLTSSNAAFLFKSFQDFGATAPKELGISYTLGQGGSVELSGVYYGTKNEFENVFGGFVDSMAGGYSTSVQEMTWIESLADLAGGQSLDTSGAAESRDDFLAKSLVTPEGMPIEDEVLQSFMDYCFNTTTSTEWFVEVNLYGGANSTINALPLSANSFGHRDSHLVFQMYASSSNYAPPYPDEGFTFLSDMYNTIVEPMSGTWGTSWGAYVNYVDPTLSADQTKELYWGTQYDRLASLKAKYDSQNIFSNPQSIQASS